MTITLKTGNLLDDDSEALTNAVNCIGVMGAGIALAFKNKFPEMFKQYQKDCQGGQYKVSVMNYWAFYDESMKKERFIINFPTMYYPGSTCTEDIIKDGMKDFRWLIEYLGIRSVAVPALGCGVGGLYWSTVKPIIERSCLMGSSPASFNVNLYAPIGNYTNASL